MKKYFLSIFCSAIILLSCSKSGGSNNGSQDTIVYEQTTTNLQWLQAPFYYMGTGVVFRIGVDITPATNSNYNYITVDETYDNKITWKSVLDHTFAWGFQSNRQSNVFETENIGATLKV